MDEPIDFGWFIVGCGKRRRGSRDTVSFGKGRSIDSETCWGRVASQLGVFVRRRFRASRERVFDAFTDPEILARWFSPSPDIGTEVLEHDLRVGGTYRLGFRFPDGSEDTVRGAFKELQPPDRLAFTWTWEAPDRHAGIETIVTIVLREEGVDTEVVISHDRFPTHESRDRHDAGWSTTLERLDVLLCNES
jgi:uncharacterized protein YndB with AHSA1/START domain